MPPKSQAQLQMHRYDDRLATFLPISKPKSRARHGWPLSPSTHPLLIPENMAMAGFYYSPNGSEASMDTCTCFLCGVRLGGWDQGDDPCVEHVTRGDCAWAETVCQVDIDQRKGITPTYSFRDALPSSSTSSRVRENTFYSKDREVAWWPHPKDNFVPTPTTLAEAGFIYCPTNQETDLVRCPLCRYEVEGWEADDIPLEIHRNKHPDCLFFTAEASSKSKRAKGKKPVTDTESEVVPAETKKTHSRTNSRSQPPTTTTATATAAGSSTAPRTRQQTSEAPSEAPAPKTRSTRTRSKRGAKTDDEDQDVDVIDLVEEEEDEDEMREVEHVQGKGKGRTKGPTKSTSTSRKGGKEQRTDVDTDVDHELQDEMDGAVGDLPGEIEVEPISKPTKKAAKSKSSRKTINAVPAIALVDTDHEPDVGEEQTTTDQEPLHILKKSTKSKSMKSKKVTEEAGQAQEGAEDDLEVESGEKESTKPKAKSVRRPRTTTKSKKAIDADVVEEMVPPHIQDMPSKDQSRAQYQGQIVNTESGPSSPGRKALPVPPTQAPTEVQLQQQQQPDRALSQLGRFTNIPPSSPVSAPANGTGPQAGRITKAIPKKGASQPTRPTESKIKSTKTTATTATTKAAQSIPLEIGAKAARDVLDSTINALSPPLPNPIETTSPSHTQSQSHTSLHPHSQSKSQSQSVPVPVPMSEQMGMTLEEWIRSQMSLKRAEIEREGRESIKAFEKRTIEARRRIENLPTR